MHLLNLNEEQLRIIGDELLKDIHLEVPLNDEKLKNFLENYDAIFKRLNERITEVEYWSKRYFDGIKNFEDDIYHVIETIQGDKNFHRNYEYLGEVQNKLNEIINDNTEIDYHD